MLNIRTAYLKKALHPKDVKQTVTKLINKIHSSNVEFDSIAVTGMSGVLIGSIISYKVNKPLILVRKRSDKSHSGYELEGNLGSEKYIIIDDTIDEGKTVNNIHKSIKKHTNSICSAIFLYEHSFYATVELCKIHGVQFKKISNKFNCSIYSLGSNYIYRPEKVKNELTNTK